MSKKGGIFAVWVLVFLVLMLVVSETTLAQTGEMDIDAFNKRRSSELAYKAMLEVYDKIAVYTNSQFIPTSGSFYTEEYDHIAPNEARLIDRGFLITQGKLELGSGFPKVSPGSKLTVTVNQVRALYGSIAVKGEVTAAFKQDIINFVNTSLGVSITYQRGYQVVNGASYSFTYVVSQDDIDRYSTIYVKAWQGAVTSNGVVYYHYWAVGRNGIVEGYRSVPYGSFAPLRMLSVTFSIDKVPR